MGGLRDVALYETVRNLPASCGLVHEVEFGSCSLQGHFVVAYSSVVASSGTFKTTTWYCATTAFHRSDLIAISPSSQRGGFECRRVLAKSHEVRS